MENTHVSEIMSTDLITVDKDQLLKDVKGIFEKHHLRHIPVVSDGKLVGIISLLDFMRLTFGDSQQDDEAERINESILSNVTVENVMTQNPMSLKPDSTLKEAAELFEMNIFHSIPVVEDGALKGIVTTIDLIRFLMKRL